VAEAALSAQPAGDPFDALADGTRREILGMLGQQGMAVVDIASRLPISRPAVSRHLRVLGEAGLVSETKQGTRRIYALRAEGAETVSAYLQQIWGDAATRFRLIAENTAKDGPGLDEPRTDVT
jgi:DNA-binding transcriptional ArsR family regulator